MSPHQPPTAHSLLPPPKSLAVRGCLHAHPRTGKVRGSCASPHSSLPLLLPGSPFRPPPLFPAKEDPGQGGRPSLGPPPPWDPPGHKAPGWAAQRSRQRTSSAWRRDASAAPDGTPGRRSCSGPAPRTLHLRRHPRSHPDAASCWRTTRQDLRCLRCRAPGEQGEPTCGHQAEPPSCCCTWPCSRGWGPAPRPPRVSGLELRRGDPPRPLIRGARRPELRLGEWGDQLRGLASGTSLGTSVSL